MGDSPVKISRIVCRLRAGSQAQFVQAEDGHLYAAKFCGNPQGNRTLINECVSSSLLGHLHVSAPFLRILELPPDLPGHEELYFQVKGERVRPQGILHLGSQCPVNPDQKPIFDFLPNRLLENVQNLSEFATMYVFDQWVGQADKRQAIYVPHKSPKLKAYFIDNGLAFNGAGWELLDRPLSGLAFQSCIYSTLDIIPLIEKAVCQVESISERGLLDAADGVPPSWFADGDREGLDNLIHKLQKRQNNLRTIIHRHLPALCNYADMPSPRPGNAMSRAV